MYLTFISSKLNGIMIQQIYFKNIALPKRRSKLETIGYNSDEKKREKKKALKKIKCIIQYLL